MMEKSHKPTGVNVMDVFETRESVKFSIDQSPTSLKCPSKVFTLSPWVRTVSKADKMHFICGFWVVLATGDRSKGALMGDPLCMKLNLERILLTMRNLMTC